MGDRGIAAGNAATAADETIEGTGDLVIATCGTGASGSRSNCGIAGLTRFKRTVATCWGTVSVLVRVTTTGTAVVGFGCIALGDRWVATRGAAGSGADEDVVRAGEIVCASSRAGPSLAVGDGRIAGFT